MIPKNINPLTIVLWYSSYLQLLHKNSKLLLEYKAYLVFLKEAGKIKEPHESKGLGKVRVKRFANTINELKKQVFKRSFCPKKRKR